MTHYDHFTTTLTTLTTPRFLHPPVCGPEELEARQTGFLTFPRLLAPGLGPRGQVECLWDLVVRPNKLITLQVTSATFSETFLHNF